MQPQPPATPQSTPTATCTGVLFVLVGPAGAGKNTIMQQVIDATPGLRQMPTATTRPPRAGEHEGIQHYFKSVAEFEAMIAAGELFEHQEVDPGKFYGVVRAPLVAALTEHGEMLIADIEVKGAAILKAAFPDHVALIFVRPPSFDVLESRIRARGGADEAEIQQRLDRARREMLFADECDYQIVNNALDQAVAEVRALVREIAHVRGCL